ncbi:HEAT repeat domain-containing protein, partial [[Kitasatospora] papulosa]|uniref:HEAT repeat domain-containing protein n=1 Tax=[Kitasatospora] papulosa TaxID=1464011 RepID=UPI0036B9032A
LLRDRAVQDEDSEVRGDALRALARSWANDPDTLALLRDRAVQDEDSEVRGDALRALSRSRTNDPDTLALLRDRAVQDEGVSKIAQKLLEAIAATSR